MIAKKKTINTIFGQSTITKTKDNKYKIKKCNHIFENIFDISLYDCSKCFNKISGNPNSSRYEESESEDEEIETKYNVIEKNEINLYNGLFFNFKNKTKITEIIVDFDTKLDSLNMNDNDCYLRYMNYKNNNSTGISQDISANDIKYLSSLIIFVFNTLRDEYKKNELFFDSGSFNLLFEAKDGLMFSILGAYKIKKKNASYYFMK